MAHLLYMAVYSITGEQRLLESESWEGTCWMHSALTPTLFGVPQGCAIYHQPRVQFFLKISVFNRGLLRSTLPLVTPKVDASEAISKMAGLDGEGGRWDEFDIAAEAFQEMVEEQKESLMGVLEEEVMQLNQVGSASSTPRMVRTLCKTVQCARNISLKISFT